MCDAVFGTLMNIHGKSKDGKAARYDLQAMGVRPELWVQKKEGKGKDLSKGKEKETDEEGSKKRGAKSKEKRKSSTNASKKKDGEKQPVEKEYLPPACYTLSRKRNGSFVHVCTALRSLQATART